MKVTWLGQGGLLFEKDGFKIMIDPYLSDSVGKLDPQKHRRVPVKETLFDVTPDVMIFTHNHLDHYDPETVRRYITGTSTITVLAPDSVWQEVRKLGGNNNYVSFNRHTVWTEREIEFTAIKAEHSDPCAIGVIIDDGDNKYCITGDTLYNKDIFNYIPDDIFALFLPVNGVGNNMNMTDATAFAKRINPEFAVPVHFGLFDELDPGDFKYKGRIIPEIYEEVSLK